MRQFRQDLTGKTDANGNASITINMPQTGEWHELKVAASISAQAEWALIVSQSPYTYGRGRRVTLGPELIRDNESVTVTVTAGPPNAQIIGTVTGKSGTSDEMLASYGPQPNTIAVDTSAPTILLGTVTAVGGGIGGTGTFNVPLNAYALALLPELAGVAATITALNVQGVTSSDFYLRDLSFPGGALPAAPIYVPLGTQPIDTQVTVGFSVSGGAGQPAINVIALLAPIATASILTGVGNVSITNGQDTSTNAGGSVPVVPAEFYTPAPWQAPAFNAGINAVSVNSGASQLIIAASALKTVYLHEFSFSQDGANAASHWTLQDTTGAVVADFFDANVRKVFAQGSFGGVPLTSGRGLQMVNNGAAASFLGGYVTYSQI